MRLSLESVEYHDCYNDVDERISSPAQHVDCLTYLKLENGTMSVNNFVHGHGYMELSWNKAISASDFVRLDTSLLQFRLQKLLYLLSHAPNLKLLGMTCLYLVGSAVVQELLAGAGVSSPIRGLHEPELVMLTRLMIEVIQRVFVWRS